MTASPPSQRTSAPPLHHPTTPHHTTPSVYMNTPFLCQTDAVGRGWVNAGCGFSAHLQIAPWASALCCPTEDLPLSPWGSFRLQRHGGQFLPTAWAYLDLCHKSRWSQEEGWMQGRDIGFQWHHCCQYLPRLGFDLLSILLSLLPAPLTPPLLDLSSWVWWPSFHHSAYCCATKPSLCQPGP